MEEPNFNISESKKEVIKVVDIEDVSINCADCDNVLLNLVRIRQSEKQQKLIVECPFCDGESWITELTGKYFQSPPEGLMIGEMDEEENEENFFRLTMEMEVEDD